MDIDYLLHRVEEIQRQLDVLRMTIDRRVPPDEVIDNLITSLEIECRILGSSINRLKKEK